MSGWLALWFTLTLVAYTSQMGFLLGCVLYLRLVEVVVERDAGLSQKAPCVLVAVSISDVSVSMAASVVLLLGSTGSQCRALDPSPLAHLSPESRAGKGRAAVLQEGKYFLVLLAALRAPPPLSAESLGSASVCPHPVSPTVLVRSLCGPKCHRSAAVLGFSCVHSCTFIAEPRSAWLAFVWATSLVRGIFTSSLSGHFRVLHHLASPEEHACEPHTALLSSF